MGHPGEKEIEDLAAGIESKPLVNVSQNLFNYEIALIDEAAELCQHGVVSDKTLSIKKIVDARSKDKSVFQSAVINYVKTQLIEYESKGYSMNHRQRRDLLEKTIRILLDQTKQADGYGDETKGIRELLLAKAYLYRGKLFRPKGLTVPDRKVEAFNRAMDEALKVNEADPENCDALKVWALAAIELQNLNEFSFKTNEDQHNKNIENITKAAFKILDEGIREVNDIIILLEYAELIKDAEVLTLILEYNNTDHDMEYHDLMLCKARAAFLYTKEETDEKKIIEIKSYALEAIKNSPANFNDPFWDDLVALLKNLKRFCDQLKKYEYLWKEPSALAYYHCRKNEEATISTAFLRWHWSRLKDIYDLAYLAADSISIKAEIADSVKSKPILRLNAVKSALAEKDIKRILDLDYNVLDRRYLKDSAKPVTNKVKADSVPEDIKSVSIPENWIAIHFYINNLADEGERGRALILSPEKKDEKFFDERRIYNNFIEWQYLYSEQDVPQKGNIAMEKAYYDLLKSIGETLPWLFNEIPGDTQLNKRNILFIPHGFLHRIPFHAAVRGGSDGRGESDILFNIRSVKYLPSWKLPSGNYPTENNGRFFLLNKVAPPERIIRKFFKGHEEKDLPSGPLAEYLKRSPELLILYSHGECDLLNPYRSKILLKPEYTISQLMALEGPANVRYLLMGNCESDMAPPVESSVDEYFTPGTVMSMKGVQNIVAALQSIWGEYIEDCFCHILSGLGGRDIAELLCDWQRKQLIEWMEKENGKGIESKLSYIAPFRAIGFPEDTVNE